MKKTKVPQIWWINNYGKTTEYKKWKEREAEINWVGDYKKKHQGRLPEYYDVPEEYYRALDKFDKQEKDKQEKIVDNNSNNGRCSKCGRFVKKGWTCNCISISEE